MTRMMIGSVILLAAMVSSEAQPAPANPAGSPIFRPSNAVSARATASIRIVSGVRFGPDHASDDAAGAIRRSARLIDRDGQAQSAELLEFQ
jgi:hypothetical protein